MDEVIFWNKNLTVHNMKSIRVSSAFMASIIVAAIAVSHSFIMF